MPDFIRSYTYYSLTDKPLIVENDWDQDIVEFFSFAKEFLFVKGYYPIGSVLNGFVLPKNEYLDSKEELFSKYGLWENRNGWGRIGSLAEPMSYDYGRAISNSPILCGDILDNKVINSACGMFEKKQRLWYIDYSYQQTPLVFKTGLYDNLYFNAINSTVAGVSNFVSTALAGAVAPNGPVEFPALEAAKIAYETLVEKQEGLKL